MVTMKIDSTGVDPNKSSGFEPYEGPIPKPGVYAATIQRMTVRISQNGNPYFNVLYVLGNQETPEKQECKGAPIWDKVVPGEADIQKERVGKLLHSICGKVKANVTHDEVTNGGVVEKVGGKDPVGTQVKLVIGRDTYQGEVQAKVNDVFAWPKDREWPTGDVTEEGDDEEVEEIEEDEEEVEEVEEDVVDDEEEDEEEEDEEDEEEDGDEFAEREAELAEMDRAALRNICKSDYDLKVLKKHSDDDLRTMILDHEFPAEADEEEEGDDEPPF